MKSDYEILGLEEGADEKEIKRAYFKLVRQFTPEKAPERFQEIREAYENLKSGKGKAVLTFTIPDDPFAKKMLEQIETLYRQHAYWEALETADEAVRYFGESEGFLYYQALLQRKNYYSGKSVKSFEKLVKLYPDKMEYAKELAISYLERGYGKKAYAAFGKAYDMGCREIEFLDNYAINCRERGDEERSFTLLLELIAAGSADKKEYMQQLLDSHAGLFILCVECGRERLEQAKESLRKFLGEAVPYMAEYPEDLEELVRTVMYVLKSKGDAEEQFWTDIFVDLKQGLGKEKAEALWAKNVKNAGILLMEKDSRISEFILASYEYLTIGLEWEQAEESRSLFKRFALLDCELCILEEWPEIKKEFEIIQTDYPDCYKIFQSFIETVEQTKSIDFLREKLKKEYDRLECDISGGRYYEKYPERRRQEKVVFDGYEEEQYVRMQPKVGRNDPCPCGSGKKYKKCCGKAG